METNGNRNDAKWDAFEEMMENKVVFTVPIDESVKAGVVTSVKGVRAFIPASQLSTSYVEDTNEWIGKEVDVVIITADREKQRLVLSGREAAKIKRSQEKKARILATGIDFINCAELHLNPNNIANYEGEPMYSTRLGYISPIISRDLTLRFMKQAVEENWPIAIHDCCNRTKFARDLNLRAHEGGWFGASSYGSEFPRIPVAFFLPTLRDESFTFVEEEPLPEGYRPGDIVL